MAAFKRLPPNSFWDTSWTPCKLNVDECLSLEKITSSFSAPITEEHVWAIVFECVKCLQRIVEAASCGSSQSREVFVVTNTRQILLHREGRVHESTFLSDDYDYEASTHSSSSSNGSSRACATSESKVIQELALVMYASLDIGLKEDEERTLSPGLENLLAHMISAGEESHSDKVDTDDEGIEQDQDDVEQPKRPPSECLKSTLGLCQSHLSVESEAEDHYRNVCRALVSEALELSYFLEKTSSHEAEHSEELQQLALKDWAHLWIQTMNELRHGVKLKKTNFTKTPIEYALTPYEMLMDDIRSRRYKLNKVMVDGELPPKVKKDAHDVILEFIRSRPPLKPVSQRVLRAPPRKYSTPQELLMESIRSVEARSNLRKTSGPPESTLQLGMWNGKEPLLIERPAKNAPQPKTTTSFGMVDREKRPMQRSLSLSTVQNARVVIRPDPAFFRFDPENDDDDSDCDCEKSSSSAYVAENNNRVRSQIATKRRPSLNSSTSSVIRRSRLSSAGTSLSNLSSVSEAPLTPCAVSYQPKVILSTPCGTIQEEGLCMTSSTNHHQFRPRSSNSSGRKSSSNIFAWSRRHSLQSQPQPLSVQGFGYRYGNNWEHQQRKVSMVAGRTNSLMEGASGAIKTPLRSLEVAHQHLRRQRSSSHVASPNFNAEKASPTLTLSHSELTHIRSALSRAKLESLPPDLRNDIVKGNICFLCTKTKFSLLFNRRHQCQLCQQSVCFKCISKAKLPEDQRFDNVPVFALSPGQNIVNNISHQQRSATPTSSATSKVRLRRSNTLGRYDRPNSVAGDAPASSGILSSLTSISSSSSNLTLNVCLDCKQAVESMRGKVSWQKSEDSLPTTTSTTTSTSFLQRRRFSYHQDFERRRSHVTKSLIFD